MRIASWNINSVRLRINLVLKVLEEQNIDILCLQETKTEDQHFPQQAITDAGWPYIVKRGEKSYNGVAILSRIPLDDERCLNWADKTDCRHISAVADGVRIHNFYVPAGGDVADRNENPKFGHKLDFLTEMTAYFQAENPQKSVLVGDLNIAPLAEDVWSTKQLRNVVSHTDIERRMLLDCIDRGGFSDAVRRFFGADETLYSWWSYRARDWAASNRGRRLDHIWVSEDISDNVASAHILAEARGYEKPSDHVPLWIDISLS